MKHHIVLPIVLVLACSPLLVPRSSFSQVPELINFQGRIADGGGLVNSNIEIILRLENTSGTTLYAETQRVSVADGLYTYCLGKSNDVPGSLAAALMNTGVWLEVEVKGEVLAPRAEVKAAAYALKAAGVEDGAITTPMLADSAVTASKIQDDSLDFDQFKSGLSPDGTTIITMTGSSSFIFDLIGTGDLNLQNDESGVFASFRDNGDILFGLNDFFLDTDADRIGLGDTTPDERLTVAGNIAPSVSGSHDLGTDALRWRALYLASEINHTSDVEFISGTTTTLTVGTSGTVTAPAFAGDGSGLTGIPAGDADTLDGQDSTDFAAAVHNHDHGALNGLGDDDHPQYLRSDAADVFNEAGNDTDLRFESTGKTNLLFLDAGNDRVGMGTSLPKADLHIVGSPSVSALLIAPDIEPSGGHAELRLSEDRSGNFAWIVQRNGDDGLLRFMSTPGTGTTNNPALLMSGDRIGIGTTMAPDGKLEVRQTNTQDILNLFDGNANVLTVLDGGHVGIGDATPDARLHIENITASDSFRVDDTANDTSPFIIANDGTVGIGTADPTYQLDVVKNANSSAIIRIMNTNTGVSADAILRFRTDGAGYRMGITTSDDSFAIKHSDMAVASYLKITTNGNVGVGTDSPTNKLHVAGSIFAEGGTIFASSDRNLKEDFAPVDADAILEKVAALPVQFWRFKSEQERVRHVGPTAQDFRSAFNLGQHETAIATVDADGIALAAIQALVRRNEELRTMNNDLKCEIEAVKARLAALETHSAQNTPQSRSQ